MNLLLKAGLGIAGAMLAGLHAIRLQRRMSLQGAVVLITGGSCGLGLAFAREFARRGAKLALIARDAAELKQAAVDLQNRGADVFTVAADVRDRAQAEAAVEQTLQRFDSIEVLINNAGIITVGPLEEMKLSDYEDALATQSWAPLFMINAVVPNMKTHGRGRIVSVGAPLRTFIGLPVCSVEARSVLGQSLNRE